MVKRPRPPGPKAAGCELQHSHRSIGRNAGDHAPEERQVKLFFHGFDEYRGTRVGVARLGNAIGPQERLLGGCESVALDNREQLPSQTLCQLDNCTHSIVLTVL